MTSEVGSFNVETVENSLKYSKAFLLSLANVPQKVDSRMLETIRLLQLDKTPTESEKDSVTIKSPRTHTNDLKPPVLLKVVKTSPTGHSKPLNTLAQKKPMLTPTMKSNKENMGVNELRQLSVSVQKPLQTSKPLQPKTVFVNQTPMPETKLVSRTPPYVTSPPYSPEPVTPDMELSPSQMEKDPHRLSQRQKQITYGYRTLGYLRYRLLVPRDKRRKEHPRTPRKEQICSKRSWDGQVKKWRRELHKWDPAADSGFKELLTADILESLFEGVPGIAELIKGLKEKLAQGTLGDPEPEDEEIESPYPICSPPTTKPSIVRTLVF